MTFKAYQVKLFSTKIVFDVTFDYTLFNVDLEKY